MKFYCTPKRAFVVVVTLVALCLSSCVTVPPEQAQDICHLFEERRSWYKSARKASARYDIAIPIMMAIMYQESGFRARAKPPRRYWLGFIPAGRSSSAYGYAQAIDATWAHYKKATGRAHADRDNFHDAIDFIAWYCRQSVKRNQIAPGAANLLYLAYHEGHGGYAKKTYLKKRNLQHIASRVAKRARRYQTQYLACKKQLNRPWWRFW